MQMRFWWGLVEFVFSYNPLSASWFCVGTFGRNLALFAVRICLHFIYFIKKFYKFYTLNVICEDNAAINCITFQHQRKVCFCQL
jgi:hypothetical protein